MAEFPPSSHFQRENIGRIWVRSSQNINIVIFFVLRRSREMKLTCSYKSTYKSNSVFFHRLWKSPGIGPHPFVRPQEQVI